MENTPVWFAPAVLAGALAAASYTLRLLIDDLRTRRAERARRVANLIELSSLLTASTAVFKVQRGHAKRLADMISKRLPSVPRQDGLDRLFSVTFEELNAEERELHTIIRASTEHALRPLNRSMAEWLRQDCTFRVGFKATNEWSQLATLLNELDAHLIIWLAKFEAWIPTRPEHALVYVADEQRHGIGFPVGLDDLVRKLVRKLRPNVRLTAPQTTAAVASPT